MDPTKRLDEPGDPEKDRNAPAYEPPAVAWEEAFEPLAAASCGLANPFNANCARRPQV